MSGGGGPTREASVRMHISSVWHAGHGHASRSDLHVSYGMEPRSPVVVHLADPPAPESVRVLGTPFRVILGSESGPRSRVA